jgi:hypothetical protein
MYLELAGCLPKRGVILVELHRIRKHEFNILRKVCSIQILLPLKVFLRRSSLKSSVNGSDETHIDLLETHRA